MIQSCTQSVADLHSPSSHSRLSRQIWHPVTTRSQRHGFDVSSPSENSIILSGSVRSFSLGAQPHALPATRFPSVDRGWSRLREPVAYLRLLLIEDSEEDAALVVRALGRGYDVAMERVDQFLGQQKAAAVTAPVVPA